MRGACAARGTQSVRGATSPQDIAAAMSPPWRGVTMRPHRILCMLVCPGSKNCERICAKGTRLGPRTLLFLVFCLLCFA